MKKKNPTKHDLRRRIGAIENALIELIERIANIERITSDYIEMKKDKKKFEEFLNGKYKQPKRKSS